MKAGLLAAFGSGALFGAGLAISGMTDRFVVLGFLDVFGKFDPTLLFVMAGAVAVTAIAFRFVLRMPAPVLGGGFRLPAKEVVDLRLIVGAAAGLQDAWIFVPAMLAGSLCAGRIAA